MATTTTAVNACGCIIQIDNTVGSLTDISGSANEFTIDGEVILAEWHVFADGNTYHMTCKSKWTFELTIIYTTASAEGRALIEDWFNDKDARTFQIDIPTSATGNRRYSGEAYCTKLSIPGKASEAAPIMVKASFVVNGAMGMAAIA